MKKLYELKKAVASRNFDYEEKENDIEFVEKEFDSFRKYFNAVYEDVCGGESARMFLATGRWTIEQYQAKIESLDKSRRLAHDRAIDASDTPTAKAR